MRYFMQELAPWFDVCDPVRHFASIVPARAFHSPTLLNAIYTASARHLATLQRGQTTQDSLQLQGAVIPRISTETAVRFQNECIHNLLRCSVDSQDVMNEDLLAASIILRTDEEMDVPLHEGEADKQIFLKVTSAFIQTQIPTPMSPPNQTSQVHHSYANSPHSLSVASPGVTLEQQSNPFSMTTPTADEERLFLNTMAWGTIRADGLRQACFWVAFRQELHGALMQQRPLDISLTPYQQVSTFSPAEDATWVNRLVVFCAEAVEHCYGNRASNVPIRKKSTWKELREKEKTFSSLLPDSFKPFYITDTQGDKTDTFPEIWYLDSIHATGAAYLELTKILLNAFNPGNQSLGLGHRTRVRDLGITLRAATMKLCGIAMSNRQAPPLFLNACSAIIMCGEHFEDISAQRAIIRFLQTTQRDLAYPTHHMIASLEKAWHSEDVNLS